MERLSPPSTLALATLDISRGSLFDDDSARHLIRFSCGADEQGPDTTPLVERLPCLVVEHCHAQSVEMDSSNTARATQVRGHGLLEGGANVRMLQRRLWGGVARLHARVEVSVRQQCRQAVHLSRG